MGRWLSVLGMGCLLAVAPVCAQSLEILTLQHRPADQVLPILRPLLEPGASLTGTGNKIFVRTSARNLAELRQALAAVDQAARRLRITVRQGSAQDLRAQSAAVSIGREVRIAAADTTRNATDSLSQQVETIDGGRAWINVGQSVPVTLRQTVLTPNGAVVSDSVVYRDIGSGFAAVPQLSGDTVTLEISPSRDTPASLPGSANIQRLSTTVAGRLGEWIALGGSSQESSGSASAIGGYGAGAGRDARQVWLKVEELR
jgi:type II secretory pathway component GspD/PulD (secretin)